MDKNLFCFVCDIAVTTRYFSLAACRTQTSKKKLIEKLGHLVGDKYMVVITEDDVICRSCANLMNTLDRLEVEMSSVRRVVLRFLETKYSLDEGDLISQGQDSKSAENNKTEQPSFMVKKQASDHELDALSNTQATEDPRSRIWMQCNTCQYTTNYPSFVNNHVRNEVCLYCEAPIKDGKCTEQCEKEAKEVADNQDGVGVELEEAEYETQETTRESIDQTKTTEQDLSLIEAGGIQFLNSTESLSLIEGNFGQILETEAHAQNKPVYLQVVNPGADGESTEMEEGDDCMQQVYTVNQDGGVELMQVMWNEEGTSQITGIQF